MREWFGRIADGYNEHLKEPLNHLWESIKKIFGLDNQTNVNSFWDVLDNFVTWLSTDGMEGLGKFIDWLADDIGLACLSRGATRMFMTTTDYRSVMGNQGSILLWLNLDNRQEVDALYAEWTSAGAKTAEPPAAHDYNKLYEFFAEDIDGNRFRIFYDTAWETQSSES